MTTHADVQWVTHRVIALRASASILDLQGHHADADAHRLEADRLTEALMSTPERPLS